MTVSKPLPEFDCLYSVLDVNKIKNNLGLKPRIDIREGLESVWKWISVK